MNTQITLTVPNDVYHQVKNLAATTQRDVADILLETITRSFPPFPVNPNQAIMNQNVQAYQSMHAELVKQYLGQYVAIHKGQFVDHDPDPVTLLQRIRQNYPNQVVLRRKVETVAERELRVRHPRLDVKP
jgi:hypothetical protein